MVAVVPSASLSSVLPPPKTMKRILITAFGKYGSWETNASWLALVELTRDLPTDVQLVTRRYPVDLEAMQSQLAGDLVQGFDFAIHLGQAPNSPSIALELFAVNGFQAVAGAPVEPIAADGPAAFRSSLPLARWCERLQSFDIPATVSAHAGTYLCNAIYYWNHWLCARHGYTTKSLFVHLPLAPEQTAKLAPPLASLPTATTAQAIRSLVQWMHADSATPLST